MTRVARPFPLSGPALLGLCVALLGSCGALPGADDHATVVEVVDGDTIVVEIGGWDETVRLIGIDTPETKHPTVGAECFGHEASAALTAMLPVGSRVLLERDVEARDRYGRLLAYVHRPDGTFVNLAMAADGFADAAPFAPNTAHAAEIAHAVRSARGAGTGLWSACGDADTPATERPDGR